MSAIFRVNPKAKKDDPDIYSIGNDFGLSGYVVKNPSDIFASKVAPVQYGVPLYTQPSSLSESVVREVMLQGTQFSNRANKAIAIAEDPAGATKAFVNDLNRINSKAPKLGKMMLDVVTEAVPDLDLRKKDFVTSKMFKSAHGELQAMLIQDNYPAYQKLAKLGGVPVTKRGLKLATKRIAKRGKKTGGKTHRKKK